MTRLENDDGFTLVELLLATVIVATLIGSIGAALLVGLKTTDSIGTEFNNSHDSQLLSAWLQPDIASSGPPNGVIDSTGVDSGCSTTPAGTTNLVRFRWTDQGTGTTYNAAYRSSGTQLIRYYCTPAGGAITKTIVVVHNLNTAAWNSSTNTMSLTVNADNTSYSFALSGNPRYGVGTSTTTTSPATTTTTSPATTTTTAPTTTTTTAPTTTTTTQPCTYVSGSGSASPSSDQIKVSGNNSTLNNNVAISMTTSGSCSSISVTFTTHSGGSTHTIPLTGSSGTWTGSLSKSAYSDWTTGSHPFTVTGTTTSPSPTIAFTVTP